MGLLHFPEFEALHQDLKIAIGASVCCLAIGGSAINNLPDSAVDVDVIVVVDLPYRQRLRYAIATRTFDVFQENETSLAGELRVPLRASMITLLAASEIVLDRDNFLTAARIVAEKLVSEGSPASTFAPQFAIVEPAYDCFHKFKRASGDDREFLRGVLLGKFMDLIEFRLQYWPVPAQRALATLDVKDPDLALLMRTALRGDDGAVDKIAVRLLDTQNSIRRGPRHLISLPNGKSHESPTPA